MYPPTILKLGMLWRAPIVLMFGTLLLAQALSMDRAWKLAGSGHRSEAIQLLREIIQRTPDDPDARLLLGSLLSEEHHHEEAIEQLTTAVRLRPQSSEAQNALGEAYSNFGDLAAARHAFEASIALDTHNGIAQLNLSRILLESQQFADAAASLDHAIETLKPGPDAANAHYLRAKAYTALQDPKRASEQLQQALAIQPAFPEACVGPGRGAPNLARPPRRPHGSPPRRRTRSQ